MLLKLGVKRENVWLCDIHGLVYEGRNEDMNPEKAAYRAEERAAARSPTVIDGADLFLGLSGPGVLTARDGAADGARPDHLRARQPRSRRSTRRRRARRTRTRSSPPARSDYPNQVNNVLCFPFIFRGALDVGATEINDEMQIACVEGIAALARAPRRAPRRRRPTRASG